MEFPAGVVSPVDMFEIEWASARVPPTPFFGGAAGLLRLLRGAQNVPRSSFEAQ